ncbi:pyridoxamine 5'-phosphate oxidase family protein [Candidatus Gottesmanbacteria bacterium]|nr:pyridoxamine 5'-phosphate oxidase family protein [Candidatus Gottesmanbacteria bacterium]
MNNGIIIIVKKLPIEVQEFISSNSIATIATISKENDYPYVLPVFYVTDNRFYLYFATHKQSKKLDNILSHPHIGISITDPTNLISLQLQGTATIAQQNPEIIQKLITISNAMSEYSMPPIMKINTGIMQVVTFIIHWYRLARYSEKNALFIEGTLKNRS